MASALARRSAAPSVHRGPSPKLVKLQERTKLVARKAREVATEEVETLAGLGTAIGLGILQQRGTKIPTVLGLDPYVLGGGVGYVLTRKQKSRTMRAINRAAFTALAIGANRSTERGSIRVGEDDDDDDL